MNQHLKEIIKICTQQVDKRQLTQYIKKNYRNQYNEIINLTSFLDTAATFSERIYCILNDITERQTCKICGNEVKFWGTYAVHCSQKCSHQDIELKQKFANTCLQKYGTAHPSQSYNYRQMLKEKNGYFSSYELEHVREKAKKTVREKFNVENVFQCKIIKDKIKKTNLEKYGVEFPTQNQIVKHKIKETNIQKYGTEYASQSILVKDKTMYTNLQRHGVECTLKLDKTKQRAKEVCLEKYGVEHFSQAKEVRNKIKETVFERYGVRDVLLVEKFRKKYQTTMLSRHGVENPFQLEFVKQNSAKKSKMLSFMRRKQLYNSIGLEILVDNYESMHGIGVYKFRCNQCGCEFEFSTNNPALPTCRKCNPVVTIVSKGHQQIIEFLKEHNIEYEINNRTFIAPLEIDILAPTHKLAIEYNGIYWHSTLFHNKNEHIKKLTAVENKGFQLITIWEDEWLTKQNIIESLLLSKLGKIDIKIDARKCNIILVDNQTKKIFLNENHLQGDINSSINIGLEYQNQIVSMLILGKSRYAKSADYEILRFATLKNMNVRGAFSKMLKYFENVFKPMSIITYAKRDHSQGKLYETNGFKFLRNTNPNYYYFKLGNLVRESRIKYQKHKLPTLLQNYDNELSEQENMINNGYVLIQDSGNKVFIKI